MKYFLLVILILQFTNAVLYKSNKESYSLDYLVTYDKKKFNKAPTYIEKILYLNNKVYKVCSLNDENNTLTLNKKKGYNSFTTIYPKTIYKLFLDFKNRHIESHEPIIGLSKNLDEFYVVEDTMTKINWTITNEFKVIDDYTCYLAHTKFKCREYYAWFSPELPYNMGPWKLNGLPGLIIEAYDKDKIRHYQLKRINHTPNKPLLIIDKVVNGEFKKRMKAKEVGAFYKKVEKALKAKNSIENINHDCSDCPESNKRTVKIWTWECYQ
jgi:GLPGLI family protein